MKKNSTKKALLMSVLSLLLCVSMLVGTTYAWFTDTVTSAGNKIVAGTLEVDLLMADNAGNYASIADKEAAIFGGENSLAATAVSADTLWEPGKTQIVYLGVENKGNLDLKYNILLNVIDGGLVGSLEYAIIDGAKYGDLSAATEWADIEANANVQVGDIAAGTAVAAPNGAIKAGTEAVDYFVLAVHMKEEAGNEYQGKDITIDITVAATQLASEEDSFDNTYDEKATFLNKDADGNWLVSSAAELVYFGANANAGYTYEGEKVLLTADIDMSGKSWTPIKNFKGTFDGQGNTISNLTVEATKYAGLFGYLKDSAATITNLVIDGADVTAVTADTDGYAGAVLGYHYSSGKRIYISNVTVTNSTITGKNGGAIAGATSGAYVSDCTSTGNTITASRNGGIIGSALEFGSVTGSTVSNNNQLTKVFSDESYYSVGTVVGRVTGGTVENNDITKTVFVEAASNTEMNNAIANNDAVVLTLAAGTYDMPGATDKDITIAGTKDTVIKVFKPALHGSDVSFKGVTIQTSGTNTGVQHVNTVTYDDVTVKGEMCLYGEKVVFNNCTFELTTGEYLRTYGGLEVEFNNCTFNTAGKALLIYKDGGQITQKVTVKGCTFNATQSDKAGTITSQPCAAIEIDNFMSKTTLITEDNTYSNYFSGEWRLKTYYDNGNVITVNGVEYTKTALDGKLMTVTNGVATFD